MMLCMLRAVSDKKIKKKYIYISSKGKDLKSSWIDATKLGNGTTFSEKRKQRCL